MRDRIIFYRSYRDAIHDLREAERLAMYEAIFAYSLDGNEPSFTGIYATLWKLIKPNIDTYIMRAEGGKSGAEHGSKGGRPSDKKTPSKPLTKPLENPLPIFDKEKERDSSNTISLSKKETKPRRQFQFDPNLPDGSGPMRWPHFGHYMTDGCPDEPFPDSDDDDIFEKNKWHWAVGIMCKYGRNLGTEGQCRHLARQMKHEKYQIQHAAKVIMNYRAFGRMEVLTHDEFKTYSTGPTGIDI